jgi:L-lactate dehydrogenase (cytochrome)
MNAPSVEDHRAIARRRLPRMLFDYIDGGSYAEITLHRNTDDFRSIMLRQQIMRDMSDLDLSTEIFGQRYSMPVGLAPVGLAGMYARRGEVQAALSAKVAELPFCLSCMGICGIGEVSAVAPPPWFQLYMLRDRGHTRELVARARAVASPVLIITVDMPVASGRYRDQRSGFIDRRSLRTAFDGLRHPAWLYDVWMRGRPHHLGSMTTGHEMRVDPAFVAQTYEPAATWKDIDWIRRIWDRPIVVKGILTASDAREAVRAGVDGIIVSNHGGRQLDSVRSTISALTHVVDAVGDDTVVMLDGGIRSGLDVLKALSLGAKACFIGRPWAFALAAGGAEGVERMLETVRAELSTAMILTGCRTVAEAGRHLIDDAR